MFDPICHDTKQQDLHANDGAKIRRPCGAGSSHKPSLDVSSCALSRHPVPVRDLAAHMQAKAAVHFNTSAPDVMIMHTGCQTARLAMQRTQRLARVVMWSAAMHSSVVRKGGLG